MTQSYKSHSLRSKIPIINMFLPITCTETQLTSACFTGMNSGVFGKDAKLQILVNIFI